MRNTILALSLLFSYSLHASLIEGLKKVFPEGDHQLIAEKSGEDCMDGTISYVEFEEEGKTLNILLLSSRVGFSIDQAEHKEQEKIEGGCEYQITTTLKESSVHRVTKRQGCPIEAENTTITEELNKTDGGFSYSLKDEKKDKRECFYSFSKGEAL